jgi:triacylglycerol lipase
MNRLALLALLSACVGVVDGDMRTPPNKEVGPPDPIPTKPVPAGKSAIVLAHGLGGSAASFDPTIVTAIESLGHVVYRSQVPGVESVAVRAAALGPQIDALMASTGATKVHVIAHSMGGLDARYLISKLGYATKVASLTTISTPHRGSPLADVALGLTESSLQSEALDAIIEIVGQTDTAALNRALVDLSETQAAVFNATVTDAPGVKYQSYAGFSTPGQIDNDNAATMCGQVLPGSTQTLLVLAQPIVANGTDRVPNDAVVSIPSAQWGTFAGCIAADHLSEITAASETHDSPAFFKAVASKL